jgi:glycosyltransferase involved in cell wall biosynthesis
MPAYEAKKEHIQSAIESVLAQTFEDWTLLIQDDCSPKENVLGHVTQYIHDPRIRYRRNEKNLGIGPNWNACMDFGDAPYAAYLFHDDLWKPQYLEKMIQVLDENPDVSFTSAHHTYLKEGDVRDTSIYDEVQSFIKQNVQSGKHNGKELLLWWADQGLRPNVIGEPSFVVLRRSLMDTVGTFHETMPQFLDSEYWIRCLLHTNWYYLKEDLGSFRVHPSAASAQNDLAGAGKFDRFDCFQTLIPQLQNQEQIRAKKAFEKTFDGMIEKYFERRQSGQKISVKGSGGLKKFCLKHPVFVGKAVIRNLIK